MIEANSRVTGLILAGGLASRMGDCKALLPLNGRSALETIVSRMRAAGVGRVLVVTGWYEKKITVEALRLGCDPVHNPAYETGMFSGIVAGVRALPQDCEAFFLLPVDTPLVKAATYRALWCAFYEVCDDPDVAYPTFRGERGHPPLIGRAMIGPILEWQGEGGLHGLLESHPHRSVDVPTGDRSVLLDMDTPEDYALLGRYASSEFFPDDNECAEMTEIAGTPACVVPHMRTVALVASMIAKALEMGGHPLNENLLRSACLLHDVAKGRPDHEAKGARWLRERGYADTADIVGVHKDLPSRPLLGEAEILYLADKLTDGERVVPLSSRVRRMEERFAPGSEALVAAHRRLTRAAEIQGEVERIAGTPLQRILDHSNLYTIQDDIRPMTVPG
jgi:CTP:molybdopterin cytidylyltransferase MocA